MLCFRRFNYRYELKNILMYWSFLIILVVGLTSCGKNGDYDVRELTNITILTGSLGAKPDDKFPIELLKLWVPLEVKASGKNIMVLPNININRVDLQEEQRFPIPSPSNRVLDWFRVGGATVLEKRGRIFTALRDKTLIGRLFSDEIETRPELNLSQLLENQKVTTNYHKIYAIARNDTAITISEHTIPAFKNIEKIKFQIVKNIEKDYDDEAKLSYLVLYKLSTLFPKISDNKESEKITEIMKRLHFTKKIPEGEYKIPQHLKRFVWYSGPNSPEKINIENAFSIQTSEVKIEDFRRFAKSSEFAVSERLGNRWKQDVNGRPYPASRPVENITWEEAAQYADWLSTVTELNLKLPTYKQWLAACVLYAEDDAVLDRPDNSPVSENRHEVDHLIGNLREMSSTRLSDGRILLLGENYLTRVDSENIGRRKSMATAERWQGIGFRLVRLEN